MKFCIQNISNECLKTEILASKVSIASKYL